MSEVETAYGRVSLPTNLMVKDLGCCTPSMDTESTTPLNKLNTQLIDSVPGVANMRSILDMGANPNATCRLNHVSACHIAAMHDNDALGLLLRSGADLSRSDKNGITPLHIAAWAGHGRQISLLHDYVEGLGTIEQIEVESLTEAEGLSELDNFLNMTCQPNEDSRSLPDLCDGIEHKCWRKTWVLQLPPIQQGWTALHSASARAQHHCVQLLLVAGADASAQDLLCRTPLDVAGCAYYMGHNVDVNNLIKTVELLLNAGGKFLNYSDQCFFLKTPLHTAVELESKAAVEQILRANASVILHNSQGLNAIHLCIEKRNIELLQILLSHVCSNPELAVKKGWTNFTVLHAAVKAEWVEGVCAALDAGVSITQKANGVSIIHIAAQSGNKKILYKILNIAKIRKTKNNNENVRTVIFEAIQYDHLKVLKWLLNNDFSIDEEQSRDSNVFHIAARYGREEILEYLIKYNSEFTEKNINKFDNNGSPLHYAVNYNNFVCAKLLISNGANVNAKCYHDIPFFNIHLPSKQCEIAELTINTKQDYNSHTKCGWTTLHEACSQGNKKMIELLLREGADLSETVDGNNQTESTAIAMLMNNVSEPTEFMEEIFDSTIKYSGIDRATVDYKVLAPKSDMTNMEVVRALINTGDRYGQERLLLHPLILSFLFRKWRSVLPFFCSMFVLYVCFLFALNVYFLALFWYKDRRNVSAPSIFSSSAWIYIIYLTACPIIIKEYSFAMTKGKIILLQTETWITVMSMILAFILPIVVLWSSQSTSEGIRFFVSITMLFTWVKTTYLMAEFPQFGYYVFMYKKVAINVFKIGFLFIPAIFGFSMCIMVQFHTQPPFEDVWPSLLSTLVMMSADIRYYDTLNEGAQYGKVSSYILSIVFGAFLVLISIILMNLLVAVAVSDFNNLEEHGHIQSIKKQIECISTFEKARGHTFMKKVFPWKLYSKWFENKKWKATIEIRSQSSHIQPDPRYYLTARLRKAIFKQYLIIQLRKQKSNDEQRMKEFEKKLEEMYKVIVKRGTAQSTTLER